MDRAALRRPGSELTTQHETAKLNELLVISGGAASSPKAGQDQTSAWIHTAAKSAAHTPPADLGYSSRYLAEAATVRSQRPKQRSMDMRMGLSNLQIGATLLFFILATGMLSAEALVLIPDC